MGDVPDRLELLDQFRQTAQTSDVPSQVQAMLDQAAAALKDDLRRYGLDPDDEDTIATVLLTAAMIENYLSSPNLCRAFGSASKAMLIIAAYTYPAGTVGDDG